MRNRHFLVIWESPPLFGDLEITTEGGYVNREFVTKELCSMKQFTTLGKKSEDIRIINIIELKMKDVKDYYYKKA